MKDILHSIINVYEIKENLYPKVYRYVTMREAENLFNKHQLYFTNTSSWAINAIKDSGDPMETFFENWWLDTANLKKYVNVLYQCHAEQLKRFNLPYDLNSFISEFSMHLSKYMSIQNDTYSYCTAGSWNEPAMMDEYHGKWKRNIIFEYKKNFHHDIAVMHEQIPLQGDILCADVFKMSYVSSISEFIESLSQKALDSNLGHWVYDIGTFIKHNKFEYEKEQRIRVQLLSSDVINRKCNVSNVYAALYGEKTLNEILEKSMDMLKEVRQEYLLKGKLINDLKYFDTYTNTEYLIISDISPKIVEKIYLFDNISFEDRNRIYRWASQYGVGVVELSE